VEAVANIVDITNSAYSDQQNIDMCELDCCDVSQRKLKYDKLVLYLLKKLMDERSAVDMPAGHLDYLVIEYY
jgi:hypothetical protein